MNSRVMILLAVLLVLGAAIAGYLGYQATSEATAAADAARLKAEAAERAAVTGMTGRVAVVVVRQPVPAFKALTADDLELDYLRVEPPNTYRKLDEVLGQAPQVPLLPGSLLQRADLQPGSDVARLLRPGERAVAIPIDEVVGGGGFVQPGDLVDILLFLRGDATTRDSAQVVMQSMRVLGFGSEIINPEGGSVTPEQKLGQRAERARARTAVLAVPESDVTKLMLASSLGVLRLAIRPAQVPLVQEPAPDPVNTDGTQAKPASASAAPTPARLVTSSVLHGGVPRAEAVAPSRGSVPRSRPAATRQRTDAPARAAASQPAPSLPPAAPPAPAPVIIYRGLDAQGSR